MVTHSLIKYHLVAIAAVWLRHQTIYQCIIVLYLLSLSVQFPMLNGRMPKQGMEQVSEVTK